MRISINHTTKTVTVIRYPVQFTDSTFLAFNRGKTLEFIPSTLWVQLLNQQALKCNPYLGYDIRVSDKFRVTHSKKYMKGSK